MLPRLQFEKVSQSAENVMKSFHSAASGGEMSTISTASSSTVPRSATMPLIPPRTTPTVNTLLKSSEEPSWFVVISPRETRGLAGPLSVAQLKQMYKVGEITDRTLVWQEGEINWQQLVHHSFLRSQLIYLPLLPPRVGNYNAELSIFDPIVDVPVTAAENLIPLEETNTNQACVQCGNLASVHNPTINEMIPDLFRCRQEVGTNEYASEVLPGFLWIGSSQAVKHRSIMTLRFSLIINCTKNMKNPQSRPPYFRCRYCPLKEGPEEMFSSVEETEIIGLLEKAYDWIEIERLNPDKVAQSDPKPVEHRGPTDAYGQPIKTAAEKAAIRYQLDDNENKSPSRVLLWSKLGTERSSFVAAAFLIKNYAMSIDKALTIVKANRPEVKITPPYMIILQKWERKYRLGMLLCSDCAHVKEEQLIAIKKKKKKDDEEEKANTNNNNNKQSTAAAGAVVASNQSIIPSRPHDYESCLHYLIEYLPIQCKTMKVINNMDEDKAIFNVKEYFIRLSINKFSTSSWSGLIDLNLSDRRLSDRTLAILFQLLGHEHTNFIHHLRCINLRNNNFSVLASKAFLVAFYPKVSADPDDEYYLLDDPIETNPPMTSLTLLDLSHNKTMDEYCVRYLVHFLKQCNSILHLNLFGNYLRDDWIASIVSCLSRPPSFFHAHPTIPSHQRDTDSIVSTNTSVKDSEYGQEEYSSVYSDEDEAEWLCNNSITDLNLGRNEVGHETATALTQMFKQTAVLSILRLELCTGFRPKDWKKICNAIRLYNFSLTELSLHSNELSVKSCEYLSNIHSSLDTRMMKVHLPMCGIGPLHMAALTKHLFSSHYLRFLDLSGNEIGDQGADSLAQLIRGHHTAQDDHLSIPPLEHLDISSCAFECDGMVKILQALASRDHTFQFIDLSNNQIGPKNDAALQAIANIRVIHLCLNYCRLKTGWSSSLFQILAHRSITHVGHPSSETLGRGKLLESLRFLTLVGNEIGDSAAEDLFQLMDKNITLELLDLGYNGLTNNCYEFFQSAKQVTSESSLEKKVFPLHVNLLGNKCDPYLLETPGMARAKTHFYFGAQANPDDSIANGYSHIESRVRGKFVVQKQLEELYRQSFPTRPFNYVA